MNEMIVADKHPIKLNQGDFSSDTILTLEILNRYSLEAGEAYYQMFKDLLKLFGMEIFKAFLEENKLAFPSEKHFKSEYDATNKQKHFEKIIGRCGAFVAAAKKNGQREISINLFREARDVNDLDVTPSVVNKACKTVFNRGCDMVTLNNHFRSPSRTAANKSEVFTKGSHQEELFHQKIEELANKSMTFNKYTATIRKQNRKHFRTLWKEALKNNT